MAVERQSERPNHGAPPLTWGFFWTVWALGPASLGSVLVVALAFPDQINDPPNLLLACGPALTHLIAACLMLPFVFSRGSYRGSPEFWLMLLYWAALGAMLLTPIAHATGWLELVGMPPAFANGAAMGCFWIALFAMVAMPVVAAVRTVVAMRASARATTTAPPRRPARCPTDP